MVKYDVPVDWKQVNIGSVLKRVRKPVDVEPKRLYKEIGIRSHGKGIFYKEEHSGESLGNKSVFWIEPDCFVVNIVFAWEQAVAKTTINEKGMIASHRFPMYKPVAGKLDLDYIVYFFKTPFGKHLLGLASPGGAGRNKTLGQQEFQKLSFPLPRYPEQRKIADILSTWDNAIAKTEELIAALQRRKKGLMQRLLTGEVRFAEFENSKEKQETKFGIIPIDWQMKKISQVGKVNADTLGNDGSGKKYHYIELSSVNKGNITFPKETISFSDLPSRARRIPHNHDVIMATVRPNLLAYAAWDDELPDYLFSTGFALITPKLANDKDFVYYSLYSDLVQRQIHGLVTGSNYPSINSTEVKGLFLFWPKNSEERKKIGQVFRSLDDEIKLHTRKLLFLQHQKKGLMQRLLTGQVRVKVE